MAVEIGIKTKKCSRCGKDKPLSEFYKDAAGPDGIRQACKECMCIDQQARDRRKGLVLRPYDIGINTIGQAQSVVRHMAELQAAINIETRRRDSLILQIYTDSAKTIEPLALRQISQKFLIEQYRQEHYDKIVETVTRYCEFGIIRFSKDGVEVELYADKAKERLGEP